MFLASRNTNQDRQLWHIEHIWHIVIGGGYSPDFAFWDGAINIRTEAIPAQQAAGFDFYTRMATARTAWRNALGTSSQISFVNTNNVANANIRAYGGCREAIRDHLGREVDFCPDDERYGVAITAPVGGMNYGTIRAGGITRNVFRWRAGTGGDVSILAVFSNSGSNLTRDQRNINAATMTAIHELGHALGYLGHSPNSNDVMVGSLQWGQSPNVNLRPAEVEHLRQIYQRRFMRSR